MSSKYSKTVFTHGGQTWTYSPEKWSVQEIPALSIRRVQDQTHRDVYMVSRHIYGRKLDLVTGLNWAESEAYIDKWLQTTKEEPCVKAEIEKTEITKMTRIL